jgi:hypothetical protein
MLTIQKVPVVYCCSRSKKCTNIHTHQVSFLPDTSFKQCSGSGFARIRSYLAYRNFRSIVSTVCVFINPSLGLSNSSSKQKNCVSSCTYQYLRSTLWYRAVCVFINSNLRHSNSRLKNCLSTGTYRGLPVP